MSNTLPECPSCKGKNLTLIDSIPYPPEARYSRATARLGTRYAFKCGCGLAFTHLAYEGQNTSPATECGVRLAF